MLSITTGRGVDHRPAATRSPGLESLKFMGTHRYGGVPGAGLDRGRAVRSWCYGLPHPHPRRHPPDGGRRQRRGRAPVRHPQQPLQGAGLRHQRRCARRSAAWSRTAVVTEASPDASPGIIFTALTAVALAGVSLAGGRGSLPRVLVGALVLATIANGLTIKGVDPYWGTGVTGVLLLGSLGLEKWIADSVSKPPGGHRPGLRPLREAVTAMSTTHRPRRPRARAARHRHALRLRPRAGRDRLPGRPGRGRRRCSATTGPASRPCSR